MHIVILSILAAAIAFAGFAPAYAATSMQPNVVVSGPTVHVDDIFPGAASHAAVAETPVPGRKIVFDAFTLAQIAKNHGIDWQPQTRFAQSVITRASRIVESAEIEEALVAELKAQGMSDERNISLTSRSLSVAVATDLTPAYRIENTIIDPVSQRVSAYLVVATGSAEDLRYRIDATSFTVTEIPVLTRRMRRGETIDERDVVWEKVRSDTVGRNTVLTRDSVVGMAARRFLAEGKPINIDDLEPPVVVAKGDLVTIYFETRNLRLTAKARAMDDGAVDQTIRLVNITSKKTIEGVVRGPSAVVIPHVGLAATN